MEPTRETVQSPNESVSETMHSMWFALLMSVNPHLPTCLPYDDLKTTGPVKNVSVVLTTSIHCAWQSCVRPCTDQAGATGCPSQST
jgi:hypothetical protein